jgi:hypothetical protein
MGGGDITIEFNDQTFKVALNEDNYPDLYTENDMVKVKADSTLIGQLIQKNHSRITMKTDRGSVEYEYDNVDQAKAVSLFSTKCDDRPELS